MANKVRNFEAATAFEYNTYFLKHETDEITMTLSTTGVEFKKGADKIESPTYTSIKLYETATGNAQAADNTDISLSGITMKRVLSKLKTQFNLIIITQIFKLLTKVKQRIIKNQILLFIG